MPQNHPAIPPKKKAILLVNLGTPDGTDFWSIRRYLKEFLSDPRVIEVPKFIWFFILRLFILTFRPSKTGRAYAKIWRQDTNESPLRYYSRNQAQKLAQRYADHEHIIVDWAMRYGKPSIKDVIADLKKQGMQELVVLPLYPQYSATTTATVADEVFRVLMRLRWQPALTLLPPFHDHPAYIEALKHSIEKEKAALDWQPDVIIASFHGLPKAYFEKGDPYYCHCHKTGRLLREALGLSEEQLQMTFQSRFGPKQWLQPYTDDVLEALAQKGVKNILVITPGFVSDCVETLEEIAIESREVFQEHGGQNFAVVPCLNDSEWAIDLYHQLTL